jgi:hypothetical protein
MATVRWGRVHLPFAWKYCSPCAHGVVAGCSWPIRTVAAIAFHGFTAEASARSEGSGVPMAVSTTSQQQCQCVRILKPHEPPRDCSYRAGADPKVPWRGYACIRSCERHRYIRVVMGPIMSAWLGRQSARTCPCAQHGTAHKHKTWSACRQTIHLYRDTDSLRVSAVQCSAAQRH